MQHGLPTSAITAIAQDAAGYLWLGSFAGLIRFDGVRFVQWSAIGTPSLPESMIHALTVAGDGSLWIGFGNMGGVGRIQGDTLQVYASGQGLPEGSIQSITEDGEGTIWAGGPGGLARFHRDRWERVEGGRGLARLFVSRSGELWATAAGGVFRWNRTAARLELIDANRRTVDITEDAGGKLWTTGQPVLRPLHSSAAVPAGGSGMNGYRLLRDRRGHLWIATLGQGLLHLRSDAWSDYPTSDRITQQHGLTNDRVLSLFEDADGSIWVGTSVGLNRLSAHAGVEPVASRPEFDEHNVRALAIAADGTVWTATDDGLSRLSGDGAQWFREPEGLPSVVVRALHTSPDGRLWVATDQGPVVFVNGRFAPLELPDGVRLNQISAITTDREGGVWLFDAQGVFRAMGNSATKIAPPRPPSERRVSSALTDSHGRIWVGFSGGGVMVHDRGRSTAYSMADGLSGDMVTAIHEGPSGTIWIGTLHGLSRFDGGRFTTLTHAHGLPGNRLTGILGDADGHLWLGTDFGFARITPAAFDEAVRQPGSRPLPYRPVDASDGLDGIPTNRGYPNAARLADGTLWFVTSGGVTVITPAAFREVPLPAPPRIERAIADMQSFAPSSVRLPPRTVRLQVDYTSLTLSAASRVRFRYKLEGNDRDWIDAGDRRQAFYTNLPPGSYRFRVAAAIGAGEWIESPRPWTFAIQPAAHQTTWFYLACALGVVAASWSAWRYRLHQIRRQHALVVAERTRLAREIHDTLLQAMAGVALQLHRASELVQSTGPAKELCERARDSLERYIRDARFAIWRLRSPELIDTDVDTALRKVADDVTVGTGVTVRHRLIGAPIRSAPQIEDHLVRIAQEALRNAVRHADASTIDVGLLYQPQQITLRVVDNGRGFDVDAPQRAHWGLAGMREHAELVGGALTVTSVPGHGTTVEATVPVQH
jgi:signal transduction histidine kinase/sugar lactone lactonase YvrE